MKHPFIEMQYIFKVVGSFPDLLGWAALYANIIHNASSKTGKKFLYSSAVHL
jgi:hypothetical protein